ncbi:hypothetical protein [Sphaerimonospora thailandensis]|uniref:Uncharacterized protein n=1 Tax=Sphaerimonospora thailandensis TaxID=795644 RepID=A0A8J3R464_9ACTN|nr:hypothetical protein [Sphaerimonospora thailandensis]GIH68123.1 hypothetical protein Mth01_03760 [Sphaerimonospora thailandensis]
MIRSTPHGKLVGIAIRRKMFDRSIVDYPDREIQNSPVYSLHGDLLIIAWPAPGDAGEIKECP